MGGVTGTGLDHVEDVEAVGPDVCCGLDVPEEELLGEEYEAAGVPGFVDGEEAVAEAEDLEVAWERVGV